MITLAYSDINDPQFFATMEKLDSFKGFSGKTLADFIKLKKVWDKEVKEAQKSYLEIIKANVEKDKNNNVILKPVGKGPSLAKRLYSYITKKPIYTGKTKFVFKDLAAFKNEETLFLAKCFEVPISPLSTKDIMAAGLSAKELRVIAPILDGELNG